jgi:hypothetical protein
MLAVNRMQLAINYDAYSRSDLVIGNPRRVDLSGCDQGG